MKRKTFNTITTLSIVLILTAFILSIIGINITGLYPAIIVLFFLALISISSKLFAKNITDKSEKYQKNYFTIFSIINSLWILIVLWMSFVILIDRVFSNILP